MTEEQPGTLKSAAEVKPGVTQAELEAAFSQAAPYANRILLTAHHYGGRLSFLETTPDGRVSFRAAVALHVADLVALRDLLNDMLATVVKLDIQNISQEGALDGTKS